MISWSKDISITISYKDLKDKEDKRKKGKDLLITTTKGKNLSGGYGNASATLTFDDKVFVVDPEYMIQAMKKIIAIDKI